MPILSYPVSLTCSNSCTRSPCNHPCLGTECRLRQAFYQQRALQVFPSLSLGKFHGFACCIWDRQNFGLSLWNSAKFYICLLWFLHARTHLNLRSRAGILFYLFCSWIESKTAYLSIQSRRGRTWTTALKAGSSSSLAKDLHHYPWDVELWLQ